MSNEPKVVSLTPAVFHLPEKVNAVSRSYGVNPIVPRGPKFKPVLDRVRAGLVGALGAVSASPAVASADGYEAILLTGSGSSSIAAVLGSCLRKDERLLVIRNGAYGDRILEFATAIGQPVIDHSLPYGQRPDMATVEKLIGLRRKHRVSNAPRIGIHIRKATAKLDNDVLGRLEIQTCVDSRS